MCDNFYPAADEPEWVLCEDCKVRVHIGDFPFCKGGHQPTAQYHPFIPWFDIGLGKHIDSLATWNRTMKEKGWDLRSKYDRPEPERKPGAPGLDKVFNEAVRQAHGGVLPVGNFLRDDGD